MPQPERSAVREAGHRLGLAVSDSQADTLIAYLALLQRWNGTYNLTAVRDPQAMWTQHLLDCMAALPPVQARLVATEHPRVLDVGSGGGLPGVVWAVLMPQAEVTCIDTVGKKAAFVRQAAAELGLPRLQAVHGRVESARLSPFDLVTSRAFASLSDFVRLSAHLLQPGGAWVAMKGKAPTEEMAALPPGVAVFHVEHVQVPGLQAQRCLVWMRREPA